MLQLLLDSFSSWEMPENVACQYHEMIITCPKDMRIQITSASYGRRVPHAVLCPNVSSFKIDRTDCVHSYSKSIVQKLCEGRQTCVFLAHDCVFGDPCAGTHKYLEVENECVARLRISFSYQIPSYAACEYGKLPIACPYGHKIQVTYANYGRLIPSSIFCPYYTTHDDKTDCIASDATSIVQNICDGQPKCIISASNSIFGDPCVDTYKYLEVEYECMSEPSNTSSLRIPTNAVCERRWLTITCPWKSMIEITYANYGRLIPSSVFCPCASKNEDRIDCRSNNSKSIIQSMCDGQQTCTIRAANYVFFGNPCRYTYKYLEVEFICVGSWTVWSECSCDTGTKSRIRTCRSGAPSGGQNNCNGSTIQTVTCAPACPPSNTSHNAPSGATNQDSTKHSGDENNLMLMRILLGIMAFLSCVVIIVIVVRCLKVGHESLSFYNN